MEKVQSFTNSNKIEQMKQLAIIRGGMCLSEEYINSKSKLKWQCKKGHIWEASQNSVECGKSWCPSCYGNLKLTIEQMKRIAIKRGGVCLSEEYINGSTKLKWQCKKGHIWEASQNSVECSETWCPHCLKLTIEQMKQIAIFAIKMTMLNVFFSKISNMSSVLHLLMVS